MAGGPELLASLKLSRSRNLGNPKESILESKGNCSQVVHGIVRVDGLHLLLAPEAHIELPAKKEIQIISEWVCLLREWKSWRARRDMM